MSWAIPDHKHVPQVLTKEGIEELRLLGLYPNAANLLATLDAALGEVDVWKGRGFDAHCPYCGEVAHDAGSAKEALRIAHEHGLTCPKDPLRTYAVTLADLLREWLDMRAVNYADFYNRVQKALAKNPVASTWTYPESMTQEQARGVRFNLSHPEGQWDEFDQIGELRRGSEREYRRLYKAWRNDPESSDAFWDLAAFLTMWPPQFGPIEQESATGDKS